MITLMTILTLAAPPVSSGDIFSKILILKKQVNPIRAERIASYVAESSARHNVEPNLILSIIYTESHYNEEALGSLGEFGLMQIMPFWGKEKLCRGLFLYRSRDNIECGSRIINYYITKFDGSMPLGLASYNRGETVVRRLLRKGKSPLHWYVHRILKHKKQLDQIDFILEAIRNGEKKKAEEEERAANPPGKSPDEVYKGFQ